jgi:Leucine-rich repeat (LRR) protein
MSQPKRYKYDVYTNDLKFKKNRNIDPERAKWDKVNGEYMHNNIDLDSIEYRLLECKNSSYSTLDLSHMDLSHLPEINKHIKSCIIYLFVTDNELTELPDLTEYMHLQILDISNNKISSLNKLPSSLLELNCNENKISELPSTISCPNLKRIECSNNNICDIPIYKNLTNLLCSNNNIKSITGLKNLEKLLCVNNKINIINSCDNLKYLDCSHNDVKQLQVMDKLVDLIINNNPINNIDYFDKLIKLTYFEMFGTKINVLPYIDSLEELFCYKENISEISKQYIDKKKISVKVHKDKNMHIIFSPL